MELKYIAPGTFVMGDGLDAHEVKLTKSYYIGVYEVTQEQYETVIGENPSHFKGLNYPVEMVSWEDAVVFCRKLSSRPDEVAAGRVYRLPTEAEWEYACRAGTRTAFSFGDDVKQLPTYAWFLGNSDRKTHPVGQKKPNPWGLYDMHGNVWEWCSDWFDDYPRRTSTDPYGPPEGSSRTDRSGSWDYDPALCQSAYRGQDHPMQRDSRRGLRVAMSLHRGQDTFLDNQDARGEPPLQLPSMPSNPPPMPKPLSKPPSINKSMRPGGPAGPSKGRNNSSQAPMTR